MNSASIDVVFMAGGSPQNPDPPAPPPRRPPARPPPARPALYGPPPPPPRPLPHPPAPPTPPPAPRPAPGPGQALETPGAGRVKRVARNLGATGPGGALPTAAPFVTFVQTGPLGLSGPATFVRIPWTPRLADRSWLMELTLDAAGLIKPVKVGWAERLVRGSHYRVAVGFHEVRDRPLFPMYFAHRDRVVRLADAPAELAA